MIQVLRVPHTSGLRVGILFLSPQSLSPEQIDRGCKIQTPTRNTDAWGTHFFNVPVNYDSGMFSSMGPVKWKETRQTGPLVPQRSISHSTHSVFDKRL